MPFLPFVLLLAVCYSVIFLAIEVSKMLLSLFIATLRLLNTIINWLISAVSTSVQNLSSFLFNVGTLLAQPFIALANYFSHPTTQAMPINPPESSLPEASAPPQESNVDVNEFYIPLADQPLYVRATQYTPQFFTEPPVIAEIMDESLVEFYESMYRSR